MEPYSAFEWGGGGGVKIGFTMKDFPNPISVLYTPLE